MTISSNEFRNIFFPSDKKTMLKLNCKDIRIASIDPVPVSLMFTFLLLMTLNKNTPANVLHFDVTEVAIQKRSGHSQHH